MNIQPQYTIMLPWLRFSSIPVKQEILGKEPLFEAIDLRVQFSVYLPPAEFESILSDEERRRRLG